MTSKPQAGTADSHAYISFFSSSALFFKMAQYPIPDQHTMSQGGTLSSLHPSPKITLQLCVTPLPPACGAPLRHTTPRQIPRRTLAGCEGGSGSCRRKRLSCRARRGLGWTSQGVLHFSRLTFFSFDKFCRATGDTAGPRSLGNALT